MSAGGNLLRRLEPCGDLERAALHLIDALDRSDIRRGGRVADAHYVRIEQPLGRDTDLIGWLERFPALPRTCWGNRGGEFALAGVGIADEAEGEDFEVIDALVRDVAAGDLTESARVMGWARFDLGRPPALEWAPFGRVRAQLPLLELRRTAAQCVLAVNLKAGANPASGVFDAQRRVAQRALLEGATLTAPTLSRPPIDEQHDDDIERWRTRVEAALKEIRALLLVKVVLARRVTRRVAMDPLQLFARRLRETPDSFHAFVEPRPGAAFVAATPERLFRRRGRRLDTEALAGTRPRGASDDLDKALARELLSSTKDQHEHALVREHIVDRITRLSDGVDLPTDPVVHSFAQLHHLRTPLGARLKAGVSDATLLGALHPTPAVCGMAPGVALYYLRETERFDRGLYAGPVGCFGRDESECAVGIRSALVRPDAVQLFSGAGIVDGSEADAEWQETIDKMQGLDELLGAR